MSEGAHNRIVTALRRWRGIGLSRYRRFVTHFRRSIGIVRVVLMTMSCIVAAACIGLLVVYVGMEHSPERAHAIRGALRFAQGLFIANVAVGLVFDFGKLRRSHSVLKWIVDILMLTTLLPLLYPRPLHPWIPVVEHVLYSRWFLFGVLGSYSIVELCYGMMKLIGRRTNPSLLMTVSFIFFIIIGSLVLMLPKCTYVPISYVDSLFVSTSAVCITGLTSVDIPTTFTPLGILCLGLLVQIGGLGVLTFTSFFAIFFSGSTSIYNQLLIRDLVYSRTINALVPTLLYIIGITLSIEAIGAVMIWFSIPDTLALTNEQRLIFCLFHSMSSFCNAGFSTLPDGLSNPVMLHSSGAIYLVTSLLVLAGAIGFPILVNFKDIVTARLRRAFRWIMHRPRQPRKVHVYDLNTKLVLYTTLSLLAVCSVLFFVLEYNNTLRGMPLGDKIIQSIFNSLTPRSAGFASVNPADFLPVTLLLVLFQMWIGGSSQSMAGGIKVNSFGAILLNLRSIILGHKGIGAFNRNLSAASVRRANAVVVLSILALVIYLSTLLLLEPGLPVKAVVFETVSALFTVGSSLGITSELSAASKFVLASAMLLGRIGIISLLSSFIGATRDRSVHYPTESIIIN